MGRCIYSSTICVCYAMHAAATAVHSSQFKFRASFAKTLRSHMLQFDRKWPKVHQPPMGGVKASSARKTHISKTAAHNGRAGAAMQHMAMNASSNAPVGSLNAGSYTKAKETEQNSN